MLVLLLRLWLFAEGLASNSGFNQRTPQFLTLVPLPTLLVTQRPRIDRKEVCLKTPFNDLLIYMQN
jgi:hypothetical protein